MDLVEKVEGGNNLCLDLLEVARLRWANIDIAHQKMNLRSSNELMLVQAEGLPHSPFECISVDRAFYTFLRDGKEYLVGGECGAGKVYQTQWSQPLGFALAKELFDELLALESNNGGA